MLAELATIVRNTCRTPNAGSDAPTFEIVTTPNAKQRRALELIQQIRLKGMMVGGQWWPPAGIAK